MSQFGSKVIEFFSAESNAFQSFDVVDVVQL